MQEYEEYWFLGSRDNHLCRTRRPPGCQAMIWHFLVGEEGLVPFPATIKPPFKGPRVMAEEVYSTRRELWQCSRTLDWKAQPCNPTGLGQLTGCAQPASAQCGWFLLDLYCFMSAEFYLKGMGKGEGKRAFAVMKTGLKPKGSKLESTSNCKACHSLCSSHPTA